MNHEADLAVDEQQVAVEYRDELCRELGAAVLRFAPLLDRCGWQDAASARTYLHAMSIPSAVFIDFIDVACGLKGVAEARQRLLTVAHTWGFDSPDIAGLTD